MGKGAWTCKVSKLLFKKIIRNLFMTSKNDVIHADGPCDGMFYVYTGICRSTGHRVF